MLVNTKKILKDARINNYAVGAYNVFNLESIKAVVEASVKTNLPIIIQASESAISYAGAKNIADIVKNETKNIKTDLALHLDHGKSVESAKNAIDAGFSSVMIDLSNLPFEENVEKTLEVVKYAHKKKVTVEAELGELVGVEDNVSNSTTHLTDPKKVEEFIKRTGVDSLAVSIGTAHGINKSISTPKIHYELLKEIEKVIPKDFPLVCHGASSVTDKLQNNYKKTGGVLKSAQGIPIKDLHKLATTTAISKINIDTDLRLVFTTAMRESLNNNPTEFNPRKHLKYAQERLTNQIIYMSSTILK